MMSNIIEICRRQCSVWMNTHGWHSAEIHHLKILQSGVHQSLTAATVCGSCLSFYRTVQGLHSVAQKTTGAEW